MTPLTSHWGGGRPTSETTSQSGLDEVNVVQGPGAAPSACTPPSRSLRESPLACGGKTCDPSFALSCLCFLQKTGGLSRTSGWSCPAAGHSLPLVRGSSSSIPHPLKCQGWALSRSLLKEPLCRGPA